MTTEENVELEKFEDTLIDALKNATKSGKPLNFKQARMALGLRTSEECLGHFRAFLAESRNSNDINEKSVAKWIRALNNQHHAGTRDDSGSDQVARQVALG